MTDKTRRLRRIFAADGRSTIVAMDHGSFLDRYPALNGRPRPCAG
jgi:DhnA family fructose-bisphosphate aldolase class Ia